MLDKEIYLKIIAGFLISLIAGLPVYVGEVYAQNIILSVKGSNDVEGFVKERDDLIITANVSIYDDTNITPDQLELTKPCPFIAGCKPFESCEPLENFWFRCTYTLDDRVWEPEEHNATVKLYYDDGSLAQQTSKSFVVDNKKPVINSFDIVQDKQNISISYSVSDSACDHTSCNGKCSGIKSVSISAEEENINLIEPTTECSKSNTTKLSLLDFGIEDFVGDKDFTLTVCDRLNQCESQTITRFIDVKKPDIYDARLVDNGEIVKAIRDFASVSFYVNISDTNFSSAKADFSDLCSGASYCVAGEEDLICTNIGGFNYSCYYDNIPINKGGVVKVIATDIFGNVNEEEFNFGIIKDSDGPVVTGIRSDYGDDGEYIGEIGNITVSLKEKGSISAKKIRLIAGNTLLGAADSCVNINDDIWECYWKGIEIVTPAGKEDQINLRVECYDDLNNACTGQLSKTLIIDKTPPVIESIEIKGFEGEKEVNYLRNYMEAVIRISVNDSTQIKAVADLSDLTGTEDEYYKNMEASCSFYDGLYHCSWDIFVSATGNKAIKFVVKDIVGNTATNTTFKDVFESSDGVSTHYKLKIDYEHTLPIDKNVIAAGVSYQEIVPFTLEYQKNCAGNQIEIVDAELAGSGIICGNVDDPYRYVTISKLKNSNDYSGFMQLPVTTYDIEDIENQKNVLVGYADDEYCRLYLRTRCGNKIYSSSEMHEIRLNLSIKEYDKEATEDIIKKIDDIKEKYGKKWEWIGEAEEYISMLQDICQLHGVFGAIHTAVVTAGAIAATLKIAGGETINAVLSVIEEALGQVTNPKSGIGDYMKKACTFVTCTGKSGLQGYCSKLRSEIIGSKELKKWNYDLAQAYRETQPSVLELAKRNWLFAGGCLCWPGIIYNLHKYRQMECWKALCYQRAVEAGMDKDFCDKQYAFHKCVFWWGSMAGAALDLIIGFIDDIFDMFRNPVATAWAYGEAIAEKACNPDATRGKPKSEQQWTGACFAYAAMLTLDSIVMWNQFKTTKQIFSYKSEVDYCDLLMNGGEILDYEEAVRKGYYTPTISQYTERIENVGAKTEIQQTPQLQKAAINNLRKTATSAGLNLQAANDLKRRYVIYKDNAGNKLYYQIIPKQSIDNKKIKQQEYPLGTIDKDNKYHSPKEKKWEMPKSTKIIENTMKITEARNKERWRTSALIAALNPSESAYAIQQWVEEHWLNEEAMEKWRTEKISFRLAGYEAERQACKVLFDKNAVLPKPTGTISSLDLPTLRNIPTFHINARRTEYGKDITYYDATGNIVEFPRAGESPRWFPESADYKNFEPLGYLYTISYYIKNPYTAEQISKLDVNKIGLTHDGNITGRVYLYTTDEAVKDRAKAYEGYGIKTKGWFKRFNIAPGQEFRDIKASYKLSYYDKVCIEFDNYKYNGDDKENCTSIIKRDLTRGAWEIVPPTPCETNANCEEGMICDKEEKICKKAEGSFTGGEISPRGYITPRSDDEENW